MNSEATRKTQILSFCLNKSIPSLAFPHRDLWVIVVVVVVCRVSLKQRRNKCLHELSGRRLGKREGDTRWEILL